MEENCCAVAKATALKANFRWSFRCNSISGFVPQCFFNCVFESVHSRINTVELHKQCPKLLSGEEKKESIRSPFVLLVDLYICEVDVTESKLSATTI